MIEQHQIWFDNLTIYRKQNAEILERPSMRGIKRNFADQFSGEAQFVYELLQNANDAKATKSLFKLTTEGLYFKHNGTIFFSVSNPETEDQDKEISKLGHINSITAIANSNKSEESNIGKFGVGFKAVFQYTETPHIYDPNFQFKIERFIIPIKLESDLTERQNNETVFYFPFNKNGITAEKAYSDILEKLKKLVYPTLFLSNLLEVKWTAGTETGEYMKKNSNILQASGLTYERVELFQLIGSVQTMQKLYLFTQTSKENHTYSIGYFLDEEDKLIPKTLNAFCFFPTMETTNLNFIIHAPFLLAPSRETIKRNEDHNIKMVKFLSELVASSLIILKELKLINDEIIKIVPYKVPNKENLFAPFYEAIKKKFKNEELLPTIDNYKKKENAYWAQDTPVLNLFSDQQLAMLIGKKDAKWVFRTLVRNQTGKDDELKEYIQECTQRWYDVKILLGMLDTNFIEKQSNEWLFKLYEYLSKNPSYWNEVKTKPIFLNTDRNAVPAFEKNGNDFHPILFLPSSNIISSTKTIYPGLFVNETSKEILESFGIKQPNLKDEIYNHILPLYQLGEEIETISHFDLFVKHWKDEGRPEEFINLIKDLSFILYKTNEDDILHRGKAREIYYPNIELLNYFGYESDTQFVDLDTYNHLDETIVKEFLVKLGVSPLPRIKISKTEDGSNTLTIKQKKLDFGINIHKRKYDFTTRITNYTVDGIYDFLENINIDKSIFLWKIIPQYKSFYKAKFEYAIGTYETKQKEFSSYFVEILTTSKWVYTKEKELVAPKDISINELNELYEKNFDLVHILGFEPTVILSKEQRIALKFENEEEADLAKRLLDEHKAQKNKPQRPKLSPDIDDDDDGDQPIVVNPTKVTKIEKTIKDLDDLQNQFTSNPQKKKNKKAESESNLDINFDEDEEFAKGIEDLKKQLEVKKSRVDLSVSINNSKKYSYDWFLAYLKLLTTYGDKQDTSKQKSISFQEIKKYKSDNKYFLLCGASSYISPEIENADDFKVSLVFGSGKKENITVEGVSKKGQDLLIYCREPLPNNILSRLSNVFKVEINFTPVIDLLDRLYKAFTNSNNIESWEDIADAMPRLNYIYGPPGTGKTTTLCKNINAILKSNSSVKFLVLTPTNKASDVVCKKLIEINDTINVKRLSSPTDPELEDQDIYQDTLDVEELKIVDVVASTIHRLPYFDIREFGLLFQYPWDYVIFDESSMTGLHYITFAIMSLFKTNHDANFIIAGDPKQIPPVIEINDKELENFDFQDESIYKMMRLESFVPNEQKLRPNDTIENLKTQYRSIPQIGQLFSELSYSSLLNHDRAINRTLPKQLPEEFKTLISSNVTFVDIPLNQDNSIYKVNKLFYSSYHTYCAILVSEIIKYFQAKSSGERWTIGIISPYKAQAVLLNKLITSNKISENVKVYSDTVHGFQGDECDIVFFVCNPNNYFYSGHEKALLSKEYIYNVAISRAKDYLIVLHPYSVISNPFINKIGISYKNNFGNTNILKVTDIEKMLFDDENYIENNSYVSGHDNVNVFGLSEMKYFIKANDTAIDIQLRDTSNKN